MKTSTKMRRRSTLLAAVAVTGVLTGCGGSGDGDSGQETTTSIWPPLTVQDQRFLDLVEPYTPGWDRSPFLVEVAHEWCDNGPDHDGIDEIAGLLNGNELNANQFRGEAIDVYCPDFQERHGVG